MAEVSIARESGANPINALRKSIVDIEMQMNRIANALPNTPNGIARYQRARRIANQYEQNINDRLDNNGYTGSRLNLRAPRYVYRYGQIR